MYSRDDELWKLGISESINFYPKIREARNVKNLSSSFFFFFRTKRRFSVRSKAWKLFRFVAGSNVMHFNRPHFWMNRNQFYAARHTRGIVPH